MLTRREALSQAARVGVAVAGIGRRPIAAAPSQPATPLAVGSQLQLFLDDWLIESMRGAELRLHHPDWREVVLQRDKPWEDPAMFDPVVIKDGPRYRMWYRCNFNSPPWYTACAESDDGIRWIKPNLSLVEINGSKDNNVVWSSGPDGQGYVLSVFKDTNPAALDAEQFKAVAVAAAMPPHPMGLIGLVSPDGLRWRRLRPEPLVTTGAFDSHNIGLWDGARGQYAIYKREFHTATRRVAGREVREPIRAISRAVSKDFRNWSPTQDLDLGDAPAEHLYKNAAVPYYRRPDIILMFPKRFLPERRFDPANEHVGLSDIVFMFSRDGLRFDRRFMEAFVRPGRDANNWHHRAIEIGPTLVPTGPGEMSLYMFEHYYTPTVRIRRLVLREDGFVSVHAPYGGGELVTRPLTFEGRRLSLNYATSAAGSVRVELQDTAGRPLPGHTLVESAEIYGDELTRVVTWSGRPDIAHLAGKPVRLRFALHDADLYSFQFVA